MLKNATKLSIMNEDLHVFIPKDFDQTRNHLVYENFIQLYSLREKWNHEFWLLDSSQAGTIHLQNLNLDLDDDLYLYDYDDTKNSLSDEGHPDFIIPVSVHVTDVNDNTPQFVGRAPYRLNISELTLVSSPKFLQ